MEIIIAKTEKERKDAHLVRTQVFVEEQGVPAQIETDAYDEEATHVVLYENGSPIGAGRFRLVDNEAKVERICVLHHSRNKGIGQLIMEKIEEEAANKGIPSLKLNSQTHAIKFYEKLGYQIYSEEFMDAGIPHVSMRKKIIKKY